MWVKIELIEGVAYLLDEHGIVWRIECQFGSPIIQMVAEVNREQVKSLSQPALLRFHHR